MNDKTEQVMHPWGFCSEGGGGRGEEKREGKRGDSNSFLSLSPFPFQISNLLSPDP